MEMFFRAGVMLPEFALFTYLNAYVFVHCARSHMRVEQEGARAWEKVRKYLWYESV